MYTEPTTSSTEGKPRGTLAGVYTQIQLDLDKAASYISKDVPATHKSHIDYFVVRAIQAKVYLTMEKFDEAIVAAAEARTKPGVTLTPIADLGKGFNDVNMSSVLWGGEVIATEAISGGWGTFSAI